jgi:hypothetical protein
MQPVLSNPQASPGNMDRMASQSPMSIIELSPIKQAGGYMSTKLSPIKSPIKRLGLG